MFTKTCFKKEKKKRLPGLTISEGSIGEYLRGIVSYLLKKHGSAVIKSFQQMNPLNLLKIYHSYDEDE